MDVKGLLCNAWEKSDECPNVGGVFIGSGRLCSSFRKSINPSAIPPIVIIHRSHCIYRFLNSSSSSSGRVRGLKGSTHLSSVPNLHSGLTDWVSTSAPPPYRANFRHTNPVDYPFSTFILTLHGGHQILWIKHPTHRESSRRFLHPNGDGRTSLYTPPGRGGITNADNARF